MKVIKIGHSAYKGTNALRFCFSKTQAVRVLCNRGMTRAKARQTIESLFAAKWSTVRINHELCELADMTEILNCPTLRSHHGYFSTPTEFKATWKNAPEL